MFACFAFVLTLSFLIGTPDPGTSNESAIIGGAVGGALGLLAIIALAIFLIYRRSAPAPVDTEMSVLIETPPYELLAYEPFKLTPSSFADPRGPQRLNWIAFENLLLAPDNLVADATFATAKMFQLDYLAVDLVCLHHRHGTSTAFVQRLMQLEMENFGTNGDLESNPMPFRGDSAATKCTSSSSLLIDFFCLLVHLGFSSRFQFYSLRTCFLPQRSRCTRASWVFRISLRRSARF